MEDKDFAAVFGDTDGRVQAAMRRHVIRLMQNEVLELNQSKGWYDQHVPFPTSIALLHSEVSEALEAWRDYGLVDQTPAQGDPIVGGSEPGEAPGMRVKGHDLPKPEGVGSEFADILIRLLDDAERYGIDLAAEFERKMKYNWTRPYRHGRTNPEGI